MENTLKAVQIMVVIADPGAMTTLKKSSSRLQLLHCHVVRQHLKIDRSRTELDCNTCRDSHCTRVDRGTSAQERRHINIKPRIHQVRSKSELIVHHTRKALRNLEREIIVIETEKAQAPHSLGAKN